jgi:hypothetical protein
MLTRTFVLLIHRLCNFGYTTYEFLYSSLQRLKPVEVISMAKRNKNQEKQVLEQIQNQNQEAEFAEELEQPQQQPQQNQQARKKRNK